MQEKEERRGIGGGNRKREGECRGNKEERKRAGEEEKFL